MGDRVIVVLPDDASDADRAAALAAGAAEVITLTDFRTSVKDFPPHWGADPHRSEVETFMASLTPAETRVLTELAHRPDTRSRLAVRLGVAVSTLDNQLAAIKRKLLDHLVTSGNTPSDGYLSMEAVIGWATRYLPNEKS